jgi:hypothetical protein
VKTASEDPNGKLSYNTGFPDLWSTGGVNNRKKPIKEGEQPEKSRWVTNWGQN